MHRALLAAIVACGCGRIDFDPLPKDCSAQRMVTIIGAPGSLAWFTLEWPLPAVIDGYQPTYAYDDPSLAATIATEPEHPLYARRHDGRILWQDSGSAPYPTAIITGNNETHTNAPSSNSVVDGVELTAAAASLQTELAAPMPALVIGMYGSYGPALGAPAAVQASDITAALDQLAMATPLTAGQRTTLQPDAATLQTWTSSNPSATVDSLARQLLFTARLFEAGLVANVTIGIGDDPHNAFIDGIAAPTADDIARLLDAFEAELAMHDELSCGRGGAPLALSDNVVVLVRGDTPKDSFDNNGWPDGTLANANFVYVRANGFLRPGWFGVLTPTMFERFDPLTGDPASATEADDVRATFDATLYAISRGTTTPDTFAGLVAR